MTLDAWFAANPGAKERLLRAAAGALFASGRKFRDFNRLSFTRHGSYLAVVGDGKPIVSVEMSALIERRDA